MTARPYYSEGGASTAFYDLITAQDRALDGDVDYYASLPPQGGSVLELGVGTGRVAIALADRGFEVTGIDTSLAMLNQAIRKAQGRPRIEFLHRDMTRLDLLGRFDAVVCPYYGLAHLPPTSWPSVLAGVARQLALGGVAAFHMPITERLARPAPPPGSHLLRHPLGDGDMLDLYMREQSFDVATGRFDLVLDYAPHKGAREYRMQERLTLYAGDLDAAAAECGLQIAKAPYPLGETGSVHVYRAA